VGLPKNSGTRKGVLAGGISGGPSKELEGTGQAKRGTTQNGKDRFILEISSGCHRGIGRSALRANQEGKRSRMSKLIVTLREHETDRIAGMKKLGNEERIISKKGKTGGREGLFSQGGLKGVN